MQKLKKNLPLVAIIGILFATGMVFANAFNSKKSLSRLGVPVALGEDDEKDSEEADNEKDNEDDKDEVKDHKDEKDSEDAKDSEDEKDEIKTNKYRTSATGQKIENDEEDEADEADEVDETDKNKNDAQEEIQDLNKDIKKVESRINVLGANGANTSTLLSALAEVKNLVSQANAKMTSAPKEAETLLETADHKLERVEKLVEVTLGDDDEDNDDSDAIEEIQDLAKDVVKMEAKLNTLASRGVDVSAFKSTLSSVKDLLSQAKDKATAGDLAGAEALTELADKKLETMEHSIELAYGDDDEEDGDEADEYKSEVAKFVHSLKTIGEVEGGIGKQVSAVAQAQNDSESKVESSIKNVNDRNGFVKFLIGPKYGSINEIKTTVSENEKRIQVLNDLIKQVSDPAVKQVLQDQITILSQQNSNLKNFGENSQKGFSLFGWLIKMFS